MDTSRISGLASGIDTETIISDLMKAERVKVDKLYQEKQLQIWKREAYNNINKSFANFILDTKKEFGLTTTTYTGALLNTSVSSLSWVKAATSSDESIATVSASASAIKGNYSVNVHRLADGVTMASGSNISVGDKTNLAEQFGLGKNKDIENEIINFTIKTENGSKTFIFGNVTDADIGDTKDAIIIDKTLDQISLNDIVDAINSATVTTEEGEEVSLGVTAAYDSTIDRFFLQSDSTGSNSKITIEDNSTLSVGEDDVGNFICDKLKLNFTYYDTDENKQVTTPIVVDGTTTYSGVDAQIDFAGATNITQSTNQFTINGISFDLKGTGSFDVKVDTNVDEVYDKIKSFIEKYNEIVDEVGKKVNEKKYSDYPPLTNEQKDEMKDSEIELWEEKAKSGLLRSDMLLTSTMQSIRSSLYEKVEGVSGSFDHITEIGITTQSYVSGEVGGKLQIDEDKLKEAIREDVNGVLELLFKQPDSSLTDEDEIQKNSGIITRIYSNMIDGMKDIINKSGTGDDANLYRNVQSNILIDFVTEYGSISTIDKEISDLEDRIYNMEYYLDAKEESYWDKFTAMEKAISSMNQQSAWLMQQFQS